MYKTKDEIVEMKITELPIVDRYSTGSQFTKQALLDAFIKKELENPSEVVSDSPKEVKENKEVSLETIDERIMTIDDFLDNFDIKSD